MPPIVVAVDGSKHSEKVVDVSCQIAKELNSSIVLIYIIRKIPEEPEGVKAFEESEHYKEAFSLYLEQLGNVVTTKLGERAEGQDIQCVTMTEFGNPVERILETAHLQNAKMIVLGLHGHHNVGLIRSLGSVARRVIENSDCPVLIVP
ncbi:MAG: universal stress protein [Nitrososphaerales archaeon]|jgi:nucleotide-binding universal stress UspA family protein